MDSKLFWGLLIILIGVSIIINHVFKVDFPLFKVIIALVIIYFGISMLIGSFNFGSASGGEFSNVFSSQNYQPEQISENLEFNSVFGGSKIDLRNAQFTKDNVRLEINAIFGSVKVYLPENAKVSVKASSVFGSVKGPGYRQDGIGDQEFSMNKGLSGPTIRVEASAAFGDIRIE